MLLSTLTVAGGVITLSALSPFARNVNKTKQTKPKLGTVLEPVSAQRYITEAKPGLSSSTVALGGLAIGGSLFVAAALSGLTPLMLANRLVFFLRASRYGPLLYIAADTLRPLTFFPDFFMSVSSGLLYGPLWGSFYSLIGAGTSATTAYLVGKNLPQKTEPHQESGRLVARYSQRMRKNPFESMVLMHSLLLPFDLVNGLAGYLGLAWKPFLVGMALGTLPRMVACVLFGASLQGTTIRGVPRLNPVTLAVSGAMLLGSLGVARVLSSRQVDYKKDHHVINGSQPKIVMQ